MIIAHLADLHVSKYGAKMTAVENGRIRLASGGGWKTCWLEEGWRIDRRQATGKMCFLDAYRLVDEEGRVHQVIKRRRRMDENHILDHLIQVKHVRDKTSSRTLARHWPKSAQIRTLLQNDPDNGNLRFCAVAEDLRETRPDWVIITGDLTDDGVGYDLIQTGLKPFIHSKRLICIPGNHDLYATPPIWTDHGLRKSKEEKQRLWAAFVHHLGLPAKGSYVRALNDEVLLAYFDSCYPSHMPGSASGRIPLKDMEYLKKEMDKLNPEALKLACLHHPVLNLTIKEMGLLNLQPGMRLRNGKKVLGHIKSMGFELVMKGHRHLGYKYQLQNGPVFLSAPSTTYGCRSGAVPFYWLAEIEGRHLKAIKKHPVHALGIKGTKRLTRQKLTERSKGALKSKGR